MAARRSTVLRGVASSAPARPPPDAGNAVLLLRCGTALERRSTHSRHRWGPITTTRRHPWAAAAYATHAAASSSSSSSSSSSVASCCSKKASSAAAPDAITVTDTSQPIAPTSTLPHPPVGSPAHAVRSCCDPKPQESSAPESVVVTAPTVEFWSSIPHWRRAGVNTLRCLVGCSLGDFTTLFGLTSAMPDLPMHVVMPSAMAAGITTSITLETVLLKRSESGLLKNITWRESFKMATKMSMVSMLAMEATENVVDLYLTGGVMDFTSPAFWASMAVSMAAGYLVPLPYNYFMLRRFGRSCH